MVLIEMPTLRESNPYLAKMSTEEIRADLSRRAYESSVFEGVRLPKDHRARRGVSQSCPKERISDGK
jgi:hypothetical protein